MPNPPAVPPTGNSAGLDLPSHAGGIRDAASEPSELIELAEEAGFVAA